MGRPREFDTEQAIDDIAQRFWRDGYEATGIADLVEATGVGRASLYAAFGSKQEMLHRSIDHYMDRFIEPLAVLIEGGGLDAAADQFRRMAFAREHKPERAAMGCLMVNSNVELGDSDPTIVELGTRYRERMRSAFRTALTQAEESGEMDGAVEERSEQATLLLLGIFVAIKGGADLKEIQGLIAAAIGVVESWRIGPAPKRQKPVELPSVF